ncbi:AdhA [Colletotrichum lupini]|uniref:AdhA n=1 Tax=Colletotrichum lupini TaxID=145971 RepID=A0A9Q8SQK3_9PEZI|nr:AdhA [Colletotrichum lupini]UQC81585.1 AdhA [Colletotrichum lupini]
MRVTCDKSINGRSLIITPRTVTKEGYIDINRDDYKDVPEDRYLDKHYFPSSSQASCATISHATRLKGANRKTSRLRGLPNYFVRLEFMLSDRCWRFGCQLNRVWLDWELVATDTSTHSATNNPISIVPNAEVIAEVIAKEIADVIPTIAREVVRAIVLDEKAAEEAIRLTLVSCDIATHTVSRTFARRILLDVSVGQIMSCEPHANWCTVLTAKSWVFFFDVATDTQNEETISRARAPLAA